MRGERADVVVVGAGIVGLTAALALCEAGFVVSVVAPEPPEATVSAVAGGLWSPFHAGPPRDVARWARRGYDAFARLARDEPAAAVRVLPATVVVPDGDVAEWWEACAPAGVGRRAHPDELPPGAAAARVIDVPSVNTARHLAWLTERLHAHGAARVTARFASIDEAFAYGATVVACPGLAAREMFGDPALEAIRGVVVEVAFAGSAELTPLLDDTGEHPTYVLPRDDGTVLLGGRVDVGDERTSATDAEVADIRARCGLLGPALAGAPVLQVKAGLRPGRPDVRVGVVPHPRGRLVVNYGHGGSGWTLAAGCAEDVLALVG